MSLYKIMTYIKLKNCCNEGETRKFRIIKDKNLYKRQKAHKCKVF